MGRLLGTSLSTQISAVSVTVAGGPARFRKAKIFRFAGMSSNRVQKMLRSGVGY